MVKAPSWTPFRLPLATAPKNSELEQGVADVQYSGSGWNGLSALCGGQEGQVSQAVTAQVGLGAASV